MDLTSLLASLAGGTGVKVVPGEPPTDLAQVISRLAQGNGQSAPMSLGPPMAAPPAGAQGASLPPAMPGMDPTSEPGGYMGVGAGMASSLPKQERLPPPEMEPTSPTVGARDLTTGSLSAPTSKEQPAPDFTPTWSQALINVGNALQGKDVADLGESAQSKNLTYRALLSRGFDRESAEAAVRNPSILKEILPTVFNPQKNLTNEQREYQGAKSEGFKGTFLDYITTIRRAGSPQTYINTDMRAENAESKGRGEGLAKRLNGIADDGVEAGKDMQALQRLSLLTSNVDPGTKTALLEQIRDLTGVALDPNTDNVQAFKAAASYLAPRMRVPGSGASSDRDVSLFMKALPSLLGTPEGNQTVIETLGGMAQMRQRRADIAAQWQRGEIDAAAADRAISALPDPFADFKTRTKGMQQPQAGELPVLTPQQYQAAPSGTRFRTPDGKVGRKP